MSIASSSHLSDLPSDTEMMSKTSNHKFDINESGPSDVPILHHSNNQTNFIEILVAAIILCIGVLLFLKQTNGDPNSTKLTLESLDNMKELMISSTTSKTDINTSPKLFIDRSELDSKAKKIIILDLDGTLIDSGTINYDGCGIRCPDSETYMWPRPGGSETVVRALKKLGYIVGIWTAATPQWADFATKYILKNRTDLDFLLCREQCRDGIKYESDFLSFINGDVNKNNDSFLPYKARDLLLIDDLPAHSQHINQLVIEPFDILSQTLLPKTSASSKHLINYGLLWPTILKVLGNNATNRSPSESMVDIKNQLQQTINGLDL